MLQVRSNSWHYWVWSLGRRSSSRPKNLCRYFWHCAFKIIGALIIAGLALSGIVGLLYLIASFPIWFGIGMVGLGVAAVLFIGLGYLVGIWIDHRLATEKQRHDRKRQRQIAKNERRQAKQNKPPSAFGLIWAFIRAKKKKYCPLIEVVDK